MRIAYAQMKVSAGHPDLNTKKILQLIDEARAQKADVIIFPERAISGKMLGDTLNQKSFLRDCELCTEKIIAAAKNIVVVLDGAKKFEKFDVKFLSEPFSLEKNFSAEKISRPVIQIGCIGIQNTGKTIYTFDGGSAVYNSRGEVVQCAEPFTECLNFIELEDIDKMPALELPKISEAEKFIAR